MTNQSLPTLILVAGLSRAGKTTLARAFCQHFGGAAHLPLDKYFLPVPSHQTFRDWVQSPDSIDWRTLEAHLIRLAAGHRCYTPCLDWQGSGSRLSDGGEQSHPRSALIRGGAAMYVLPGCHAFATPPHFGRHCRVFVSTPVAIVAQRLGISSNLEPTDIVARHQPRYLDILHYETQADFIVRGIDALDQENKFLEIHSWVARNTR